MASRQDTLSIKRLFRQKKNSIQKARALEKEYLNKIFPPFLWDLSSPDQRLSLGPRQGGHRALTTGPPGISLIFLFLIDLHGPHSNSVWGSCSAWVSEMMGRNLQKVGRDGWASFGHEVSPVESFHWRLD